MVCPVCSESRKKKTDKCFSYNSNKDAGRCNHCGIVLVKKKEFEKKIEHKPYKRPLFKNNTTYSPRVQEFLLAVLPVNHFQAIQDAIEIKNQSGIYSEILLG
jgi:hypothetical protein